MARATVRSGDRLTVHALDSDLGPATHIDEPRPFTIIDDLPGPRPLAERSPRWAVNRTGMLLRRNLRRRELLRSGGFDVAHIHLLDVMTDSWSLRQLHRTAPLVSTVHDVRPHHRRLPEGLERELLTRVYRHAGTLVVYHDYLRRQLVEHFDVERDRIHVIPHPIRVFTPSTVDKGRRSPTVLFFGALRRNKGVGVLLEAIERLRSSDVRFHIAGRGVAELEALISEATRRLPHLTADIGFISNQERQRLYHTADLVVLPYTSFESQSGVLADAYSFGVPLVVTDVGALGDTVRDDGTGWVVPAGDPDRLAEALESAIADEAGREGARRRMSRIADERSEPATGARFRALYDGLLRS